MPVKVLIIIPCYNEEASLPVVLKELKDLQLPPEFILDFAVINDCSIDNTVQIAESHGARVLDLPCNLGIGGAVQTGIKYADLNKFDVVVQMDGDGQHPPTELVKLLRAYQESRADIVIGSRFLDKVGFQSSFLRRLGINYFYRLNKLLTGNPVYDSTSGYRLLGKKAISLAASNYPDEYPEPESLVIFARKGLKIKEVPVIMRARAGGQSSIQHSASLYYCVKVTIAMLFSFIRKY